MAEQCALCGNESRMRRSRKRLYGYDVCSKCLYRFANRRQLAWIVDVIVFYAANFVFGTVLAMAIIMARQDPETVMDTLYWPLTIGLTAVFICKDGFYGYSPGKLLCGVRVHDETTGEPIGFGASFKRNLSTAVPIMPLVIAYQLSAGNRTGDAWANTKVVWTRYADNPVFAVGAQAERPPQDFAPATEVEQVAETNNPYQAPRG